MYMPKSSSALRRTDEHVHLLHLQLDPRRGKGVVGPPLAGAGVLRRKRSTQYSEVRIDLFHLLGGRCCLGVLSCLDEDVGVHSEESKTVIVARRSLHLCHRGRCCIRCRSPVFEVSGSRDDLIAVLATLVSRRTVCASASRERWNEVYPLSYRGGVKMDPPLQRWRSSLPLYVLTVLTITNSRHQHHYCHQMWSRRC